MRDAPHASNADPYPEIDLGGLRAELEDWDVCYAVLFGSYASGDESSTSDLDVGIRFLDGLSRSERFRQRNRIDAVLQSYADPFVDVSDLEALPDAVALTALQSGTLLYGDTAAKDEDTRRLERRVEQSKEERTRQRREFIDRLAEGNV